MTGGRDIATPDLFANGPGNIEALADGAVLLRGFARDAAQHVITEIARMVAVAPFRNMLTPGGHRMSAAMTNCGSAGWIADRSGYRYERTDPETGQPWPAMPNVFLDLARKAAAQGGFEGFSPDACLINRYEPGAKLSLHQDRDERDFGAPIVSVSLGLPALFLFGGPRRADRTRRISLAHGDIVVWGGPARLYHHGVAPLKDDTHPLTGRFRYNLTLRKAF